MKKLVSILLITVLVCTSLAGGLSVFAEEAGNQVTIDILHTNDIHGRSGYQDNTAVGFEKLKTYVRQTSPDLILDAGDLFHGQAFATLEQGQSIAELIKAIGYDAITPGNHDWNYGQARLRELSSMADTPVLAGNISKNGEPFFGNQGVLIKEVNGVKIGVFGVFDPDIQGDTAPDNIAGLTISDDVAYANQAAKQLKERGCDLVVALSHQLYCDAFVQETKGIDVLIAGHEHALIDEEYPNADGKPVKVVESGKYFENAGLLTIVYNTKERRIESCEENFLSAAEASALSSDPEVVQLLQEIRDRQVEQLTQVIGTTGRELEGRWENLRIGETSLGRLVTAAYLKETGADISFENAGGIRLGRTLPAGSITYQDVLDTCPFSNYIVTKQLSGRDILVILEQSIEVGIQNKESYDEWIKTGNDQVRWPDNSGSYLQFGGLTALYDVTKPQGQRVQSVQVGSEALQMEKMYTVATNNFISLGNEYSPLADAPELHQYAACDEALVQFIQLGEEAVNRAADTIGVSEVSIPDNPSEDPSGGSSSPAGEENSTSESSGPKTGEPLTSAGIAALVIISAAALFLARSKRR